MVQSDPKKYPTIIDCTEIPIEHSSNPEIQQITFSQYKNTTTMKGLVAVSENGLLCTVLNSMVDP